jgi:hypothetical protein
MTVIPKPAKGAAAKAKRARRRLVETRELAAKNAAKARDGGQCRRCGGFEWPEAAHLINKGIGGDHGRHSSHPRDFLTLCPKCHRGPWSVHSGHVRMVFDDTLRGDGPVEFYDQIPGKSR